MVEGKCWRFSFLYLVLCIVVGACYFFSGIFSFLVGFINFFPRSFLSVIEN